jgi:hypothetical protein
MKLKSSPLANRWIKISIPILSALLIFITFQNCSESKDSAVDINSEDSKFQEVSEEENPTPVEEGTDPDDEGSDPDPDGPAEVELTPEICYKYYFTAFPWENSSLLETDRFQSPQVVMGAKKLGTFKIFENEAKAAVAVDGIGWQISAYIKSTETGTQTIISIPKLIPSNDDYMDCYFAPGSTPSGSLNIGLSGTPFNLIGHLSTSTKYIACRIVSQNYSVRIYSADGKQLDLGSSQSFVLKRGCYK